MSPVLKASHGILIVLLISAVFLCSIQSGEVPAEAEDVPVKFALHSTSFQANGEIPSKFTCSGSNVSPELSWSNGPSGTQSFVLIMSDPDAPSGDFTHWLVYDIPAMTKELTEAASQNGTLPTPAGEGRNDFGKAGYGGPCPPPGKPHRYVFRLYALGSKLKLRPGGSRSQVEQALQGHVLAQAELAGRYGH